MIAESYHNYVKLMSFAKQDGFFIQKIHRLTNFIIFNFYILYKIVANNNAVFLIFSFNGTWSGDGLLETITST